MRSSLALTASVAATIAALTGCSSSSSGGSPGPTANPSSGGGSSTSASPSSSPSGAALPLTVSSSSVVKSTLASGTHLFGTGGGVTQGPHGLTLNVKPNGLVVDGPTDSHGIPQSFEVRVVVKPPTPTSRLLYGVGCQGDYEDFSQQYVVLTDATGAWEILKQTSAKQFKTLASGNAAPAPGDTLMDVVCAQVKSPEFTTRISLALNDTIVHTLDSTDRDMALSNSVKLIASDPGTGKGGSVTFHDLQIHNANAPA